MAASDRQSSANLTQSDVNLRRLLENQPYEVEFFQAMQLLERLYPGRENWDKTEWYEAQFKSAKTVVSPEHVDEWHNGGLDQG